MDMTIDTGLNTDIESIKTLKTLLISYIIIMQSELFSDISCNLLILADNKEYIKFNEFTKHPQKILRTLKTNDERLNNIIYDLTINDEKYKKNFNILVTDAGQEPSIIRSEIILFLNMIKAKDRLRTRIVKQKPVLTAVPKINAAPAADVILRLGSIFYKNGEEGAPYNSNIDIKEREIYIIGNFTSYTRLEVIERLLCLIKTGFGNEFNLKKEDSLILNIPGETIIDTTTPITLAQLLSKELHDFKNIQIKTTTENYNILQQSKGFGMIQKNIIIYDN